jgi:hypothetical protein
MAGVKIGWITGLILPIVFHAVVFTAQQLPDAALRGIWARRCSNK